MMVDLLTPILSAILGRVSLSSFLLSLSLLLPAAAAFADGDGFRIVPACPVERVTDTVGAGDAHAGALLLALSRGEPLARAVALADRAAALAVQTEGSTAED